MEVEDRLVYFSFVPETIQVDKFTCMPVIWILLSMLCVCVSESVCKNIVVPVDVLFIPCHLTLRQPTLPLLHYTKHIVFMWMAWSCFQKEGWLLVAPDYSSPLHRDMYAHTHMQKCTLPFPLLLHNSFTRCWTCSNEVWSFCDATGKLPCGTLLSILVHHLRFLTPHWLEMAHGCGSACALL